MAEGFLGRWSKRKAGIETKEEAALEKKVEVPKEASSDPIVEKTTEDAPPPLTLEDVAKIDRFDPDFSAFMKPDVDPTVQQAALKKMFTDPHFNVMDGLDIYIDDYSKPDPIPLEMLKRMVQSDLLNIFRKDGDDATPGTQTTANTESEPEEQALPLSPQTDLTSTPTPIQEAGDKDPVPVDKKTS